MVSMFDLISPLGAGTTSFFQKNAIESAEGRATDLERTKLDKADTVAEKYAIAKEINTAYKQDKKLSKIEAKFERNQLKNLAKASKKGISTVTSQEAGIVADSQALDYYDKKISLLAEQNSFLESNKIDTALAGLNTAKEDLKQQGEAILKESQDKLTNNFLKIGGIVLGVLTVGGVLVYLTKQGFKK